jgi:multiple sugar transport system permease protein
MEAAAEPRPKVSARRGAVLERRGFLAAALIAPAILFITLLVGGPLVLAIYLSFTDATAGNLTGNWIGLENFRRLLDDPVFRDAFGNTFFFTFVSQAIVILGAAVLAHFLLKPFRFKWILRLLILLPWAAPVALTTLAWLWIFDSQASVVNWVAWKLGFIEFITDVQWIGQENLAMGAIITAHAWRLLPFATVIMIAGLASIPKEVHDAAAIDGATGVRKLWYVTLPLQLPIATIAVLFGIVFTATDMAVVKILTNGGPFNSTQMLTTWAYATGVESQSLGAGAAVSLFMLPILAVVTILMLLVAKRTEVA